MKKLSMKLTVKPTSSTLFALNGELKNPKFFQLLKDSSLTIKNSEAESRNWINP